jgi:hypothetical protein
MRGLVRTYRSFSFPRLERFSTLIWFILEGEFDLSKIIHLRGGDLRRGYCDTAQEDSRIGKNQKLHFRPSGFVCRLDEAYQIPLSIMNY